MEYKKRIIDETIKKKLKAKGAVLKHLVLHILLDQNGVAKLLLVNKYLKANFICLIQVKKIKIYF